MRLLFLATDFGSQYRALRCVAALSHEVFVAGSGGARLLALSRFCKRFLPFDLNGPNAVSRLNELVREAGAEMLIPGDLASVQFLARVRAQLETPVFPISDLAAIQALGTKDRFAETCRTLGIRHPSVEMFADKNILLSAVEQGRLQFPLMLKPLDRTGGTGVIRIDEHNARAEIERVDYAPILTQAYVEGADRCISLACREGKVLRQAIYEHERGTFRFFADAALTEVAAEIVSALNLTGLVNFDARITTDGTISMIECNPRFTFNMDVAMVAGLNFADWTASSPGSLPEQEIRIPKALARALLSFQKPLLADFRMLLHWLKDPLIFALVSIGYPQRWRLPVAEQAMTSGKSAV